ncbi:hypothetical protein L6452_40534 [Arctium lappa]|uniref:Uncharacterized protein n=1 Tax=Arctium lappa TaxID=4217 RepID=A0ACB8XNY7_ARCLA|nr:hypothetical protein L6452_40534 [Arctium lappa]
MQVNTPKKWLKARSWKMGKKHVGKKVLLLDSRDITISRALAMPVDGGGSMNDFASLQPVICIVPFIKTLQREYNSKLLEFPSYIIRRQAIKIRLIIVGDSLFNFAAVGRHVARSFKFCCDDTICKFKGKLEDLDESSKCMIDYSLQLTRISRPISSAYLLQIGANFYGCLLISSRIMVTVIYEYEDEHFEADKAQVVREIDGLEPREH